MMLVVVAVMIVKLVDDAGRGSSDDR